MGKEKSGKPGRIFYRIFQIFGNSILVPGTGTGTRFKGSRFSRFSWFWFAHRKN